MALTIKETIILKSFGEQITDQLKNDIKTKKITKFGSGVVNASGALHDSVRYEVYDEGLRIYALDYIFQLAKGRAPTKKGGDGSLRGIIRRWIDTKGITPRDNISKDSLAYLITRKIHKEGTSLYPGGSDLISDVISQDLIENILDEMTQNFLSELSSDMAKVFEGGRPFVTAK